MVLGDAIETDTVHSGTNETYEDYDLQYTTETALLPYECRCRKE
jgi:hypothetical protein